jgi:hypothetical protein
MTLASNDIYNPGHPGLTGPIIGTLGVITPDDNTDLRYVSRQISVGADGNVSVVWLDGSTSVEPVVTGKEYPWRLRRINATGTTATGLRVYY